MSSILGGSFSGSNSHVFPWGPSPLPWLWGEVQVPQLLCPFSSLVQKELDLGLNILTNILV